MKNQPVEEKAPEGTASTVTIRVPEKKIGIVIGPKGTKIKMIQEKTGVSNIDTTGEIFTIVGKPQAVAEAKKAVVIQKIKEVLGVEVNIPQLPPGHNMQS